MSTILLYLEHVSFTQTTKNMAAYFSRDEKTWIALLTFIFSKFNCRRCSLVSHPINLKVPCFSWILYSSL